MQLSDLVYDVRPDVAGCPDFVIRDAIQKAAADFFYDSHCWIEQLDAVPLASGVYQYDFSLPSDALLLGIYNDGENSGVKIDRCGLRIVPEWELFDASKSSTDIGQPRYCAVVTRDDSLIVWPTPGANEVGKLLSILAVLGITREALEIPDQLGHRWRDAIIMRAKATLMKTSGKPWSDPPQGEDQLRNYRRRVATARAEAHTGRYAQPQRLRYTPFA